MTRDKVLHEFSRWTGHPNPPRPLQTYWYDTDAMADEIVKLRALLRALREPSRSLLEAAEKRVEIFDQIDAALDAVREWHREDMARNHTEDA